MAESTGGVLSRVGRGITRFRNFVVNTLFILLLAVLVGGLINSCQTLKVPDNSALLINPKGVIVESATLPDPFQELFRAGPRMAEIELDGLLRAIDFAASDDLIKMIVLDLDELAYAAPSHAQRIGEALQKFSETGKKVVSYGHYYTQSQYHIASFADAVYMHPMGQVVLDGFGGFNFYFNELLENFDVNVHVFRVGTFKSAVEPLLRNDMSAEARMAAEALYQNIWQHLLKDVAANRLVTTQDLQTYADDLGAAVKRTQGDMARAALEAHLVDELLTADQANVRLADDVGFRDDNQIEINGLDYRSYLQAHNLTHPEVSLGGNKIAVIVAQGMIVNTATDDRVVAADTTIELIRRARADPQVKAVVLRVDSPGGSALASELIRQELELLQVEGKPLVHDITEEMKRACESIMPPLIETIMEMIARVDPEFQKTVRNNIVLAGCGSQIRGISDYIKDALKSYGSCQISTVEDPLFAGANGSLALAREMPKKYWKKLNN